MSKQNHSPNCTCYECTGGDHYIARLRSNYGKNAGWKMYGGVTPQKANFNHYDMDSVDPVTGSGLGVTVNNPLKTFTPVPTGNSAPAVKANLKGMVGDALGGFLGDLIIAKQQGQTLPPILDKAAGLGISISNNAQKAALEQAQLQTGKNVLKFSPIIIGVLAAIGVVLIVLITKHK